MELYTTISHMKRALNGSEPPMTPITAKAARFIAPDQVLGMGGLIEDEKKGLRCPIRGCGEWTHQLTKHLNKQHRGAGGAGGVKAALGISQTTALVSTRTRRGMRRGQLVRLARPGERRLAVKRLQSPVAVRKRESKEARNRMGQFAAATKASDNNLNRIGWCIEQTKHALDVLTVDLGHEPSEREFLARYGFGVRKRYRKLFGSWSSLKAQCGQRVQIQGHSTDDLMVAFRAFWDVHGRLPTSGEANRRDRMPVTPSAPTVLKVLGMTSWPKAMSHMAWLLGVRDPSYSPIQRRAA